ncbi:MAG TPA: P1 family peptidase [Actinomycetota bacterium]|nr:P1 family peptidase [Actinomycetota bacterium]
MITAVSGIRVGHWSDPVGMTGCTVVLPPPGTVGSGEVRGGAPGTRETDLLRPGMLVSEVHAVVLSGGSAFGLAAADGVARWLEEQGTGFDTGVARVPIVPAAVLFDLGVGDASARPGPDQGYAACRAATEHVAEGGVGAGTGATVAKLHGPQRAVPGGVGTAAVTEADVTVGALAAVNAYGEVVADDGTAIAGALPGEEGEPQRPAWPGAAGTATTIAVVATDARLTKDRAHLLAVAAHDGLARAVRPAHTMWDGDTIFTLATGRTEAPQPTLERMAEQVLAEAIRRAVRRQP